LTFREQNRIFKGEIYKVKQHQHKTGATMHKLSLDFSKLSVITIISLIVLITVGCGQSPRVSPAASVTQILGASTEVTINYNRPGVKGRTVWGDLVPYNKVWRTGANEATVISFSADVMIEGQPLPAGRYALFSIPAPDQWTIIFNEKAEQWGAYDYSDKDDALRVTVKPQADSHHEWMQFDFVELAGTFATVVLRWDKLRVPFKIETQNKEGEIRASLKGGVSQTLGENTRVEISCSRPGVKGRTIWDELVPLGQVWRTGANENTTISFSGDVMVEGQKLAAGTYGLHTIPGENEWTIIFSNKSNAWGSFDYNPDEDALRKTVKPRASEIHTEWMSFSFLNLTPGEKKVVQSGETVLSWGKLAVPFTVAVK
jgi:hypothetical protein